VTPQGERDRCRFTIIDSGVGITPEGLTRLFQRFSQVDSGISRVHGGSGLGLAISKGLAELMGGQVGVMSEPGKGSAFWVELELERVEAASADNIDVEGDQGLGAHILLVDDHPMNRELGQTVLALLGCTCDVAADGREAIEAAGMARYDAILMDVHMPGIDGLAATRAIRALPGAAGAVPIIAMSADVLPEHVDRCRVAGMVDSVGKPINIEVLHACLTRWIGRDREGQMVKAA
jgi:CheY-like chemotaxis protein